MQITLQPSRLMGAIEAPASKSSMQRACAAALLSPGETIIGRPGHSKDDLSALNVIQALGAQVRSYEHGTISVQSEGVKPVTDLVHCGESGLGIRMFAPIISLSSRPITISGEGSLLTRPLHFFDEVLPQLGVEIRSNNGLLPLYVKGPLRPHDITIDASLSSQFLTGLLMAFSVAGGEATIAVKGLQSKPYIDLTLKVMRDFYLPLPEQVGYDRFYFGGQWPAQRPLTIRYDVEGDWSGAAFLLVAGAVAGSVTLAGLDLRSAQADRAILTALECSGASLVLSEDTVTAGRVQEDRGGYLRPFEFDATDCPDLFPPLVSLASYCAGTSKIRGWERLTHKESNRSLTLREEFGKMGVAIEFFEDWMLIHGGRGCRGAWVDSHHDHRIAMACAVAALGANGATIIREAQAVNKSYPDFFRDLSNLGASVQEEVTVGG